MPRTGRGGVRQGTPGTAYGNRTDLNAALPVQAATGQGYGEAGAQQAAQRAIPVAGISCCTTGASTRATSAYNHNWSNANIAVLPR